MCGKTKVEYVSAGILRTGHHKRPAGLTDNGDEIVALIARQPHSLSRLWCCSKKG